MDFDATSIVSTETAPLLAEDPYKNLGKIESWIDLLWPQPQELKIDPRYNFFIFKLFDLVAFCDTPNVLKTGFFIACVTFCDVTDANFLN